MAKRQSKGKGRARPSKQQRIRTAKRKGDHTNPRKLAGCDGKQRFTTYADARRRAEQLVNAHAYRCDFCPWLHVGRRRNR